jgi:hypothetical protein
MPRPADPAGMSARLAGLLPRLFALTIIGLLAASSITFAAATVKMDEREAQAKPLQAGPDTVRVPDVRDQAYVFAKGILEDAGFSWRVVGSVEGYAANLVAVQYPAPETLVLDTGAPTIELRLEHNPDYSERGVPENSSSYEGTALRFTSDPNETQRGGEPEGGRGDEPPPAAKAEKDESVKEDEVGDEPRDSEGRKPDFVVHGAPAEPADEMPLPDRARLVEQRIGAAKKPTRKLVRWWLYQHSWIVTGARFGWHDGAEALRILVRVDRSIQARWDFGVRSTRVAKRALAEVERKAAK